MYNQPIHHTLVWLVSHSCVLLWSSAIYCVKTVLHVPSNRIYYMPVPAYFTWEKSRGNFYFIQIKKIGPDPFKEILHRGKVSIMHNKIESKFIIFGTLCWFLFTFLIYCLNSWVWFFKQLFILTSWYKINSYTAGILFNGQIFDSGCDIPYYNVIKCWNKVLKSCLIVLETLRNYYVSQCKFHSNCNQYFC